MKRVLTAVILLSALFTSCGTVSKTAEGQKIRLSKEQIELQKLHNKRDEIIRHIKETSYKERSKAHPGYISCLDKCSLSKKYFWSISYPEDDPVFKAYKKRFIGWFNEDCPEANRLISYMILADYFDLPKPARVNFEDNILNACAVTNTRHKYVRISKDAVSVSYVYYHEILHLVFPSHTHQIKNILDNLYSPVYGVTPDDYDDAVKEVEKAMLETLSKDINLYKRSIYKPSRHRYYYR